MATKKLLKVTVQKSRWYRGNGHADSYLLGPTDSQMCCIGFLARTCGLKAKDIRGVVEVEALPTSVMDTSSVLSAIKSEYSNELYAAYDINDSDELSDSKRIQKLKSLGQTFGVNFVFVP